ncbi:MAG TPA: hypothetical protein VFN76_07465, partial [Candidatus Limnocylindria bacterium]|nr:hypothetical protein [Candidatus Limnocylindria bacterium]
MADYPPPRGLPSPPTGGVSVIRESTEDLGYLWALALAPELFQPSTYGLSAAPPAPLPLPPPSLPPPSLPPPPV